MKLMDDWLNALDWVSVQFLDSHMQGGPPVAEDENDEGAIRAPGGYYYFGAAKNLPGVRELLKPKSMRAMNGMRNRDLSDLCTASWYCLSYRLFSFV